MAIGVLSALAAAGRRVPADVRWSSCDDMPFAEFLIPSLTSLRVPFTETGEQAVELLLRRIAGEPVPERAGAAPGRADRAGLLRRRRAGNPPRPREDRRTRDRSR